MGRDSKGEGMRRRALPGARPLLLGMVFLLLASCAGTMKGYPGSALPSNETAIIKTGPYARMLKCDDQAIGPSQLKVAVLPGKHTIEMGFVRQLRANRVLYSRVTGSVTFQAEAGHTYSVDAELVIDKKWLGLAAGEYDWQGYVKDQGTGQTIARTLEPLPVRTEWIPNGPLYDSYF